MSKLGTFFGSKPSVPAVGDKSVAAEKFVAPEILASSPEPQKPQNVVVELDNELFLPIARQLGEDNESVRNLLIDAEQKINELDTIKREIGKLVEPVSKTLRDLEEAKSELAARRAQVADLQGRVLQQSEEVQVAQDEIRRLSERVALADKQTAQLESDSEATRQKLMVSENDRITVQKSLDKAFAEMSQMSQRLLDADKAFANSQVRVHSAEQKLAETQTDHRRLTTELDEAKQKHQSEIISHKRNYATLQTRAAMTNKLLEDMRKNMVERAEEIQSFDRRMAESLQPSAEAHRDAGELHPVAGKRSQGD